MPMTPFDIVLVNVVSYMGGIFTGMGFCFRYKNSLIARSRSQDRFVRNPVDVTHHMQAQPTQPSAPVHLATVWTGAAVDPGAASEVLRFELSPSDVLEEALWVVVDDDDGVEVVPDECNEDNNVLSFDAVSCP